MNNLPSSNTVNDDSRTLHSGPVDSRPGHGGALHVFCHKHGFEPTEVLDLSSGISPWAWPVPSLPQDIWQRLPHTEDYPELIFAAAKYYQCQQDNILAVAGSQSAIEVLPSTGALPNVNAETIENKIASKTAIAIPQTGYQEHGFCWQRAGYQIHQYSSFEQLEKLVNQKRVSYAVVINPNNPSAAQYPKKHLYELAEKLGQAGGFLIVDEAFMDTTPENSMANIEQRLDDKVLENLVVLKSVGKFFGLAGLRLGFVISSKSRLEALKRHSCLWAVSGAAHWLGAQMLQDQNWIQQQQNRLKKEAADLCQLLTEQCSQLKWRASSSFVSGFGSLESVKALEQQLATKGILVRTFYDDPSYTKANETVIAVSENNKVPTSQSIVRIGLFHHQDKVRFTSAITNI